MENQHEKISGYRDLSEREISAINHIKGMEQAVASLWKKISDLPDVDRRWTSIARTHFEEGFSALVRSVAKPDNHFDK